MIKWVIRVFGAVAVVLPLGAVAVSYMKAYSDPYGEADLSALEVPRFKEIDFPFSHRFDKNNSLPFLGSAIIDGDGDGTPEVFIGGGYNQPDMILSFAGYAFVDASSNKGKGLSKAANDSTFGAAVIDADSDGRSDIFVARDSGISLYLNKITGFERKKLAIQFDENSVPLSIALADLNHDGHVDMFVSTYIKLAKVEGENIFNKKGYGSTSLLLMNNGDNTFVDITAKAGMAYVHNTFVAVFSDVDRDGDQDLVVAHDTGQVRTWRNNGDLTFDNLPNPSSDKFAYPMGVGVGDYNNDGRIDFLFSNVSTTPPRGVGLVWKIQVIDLVRFWCRDGRPKTAIRDNGPLQGRILSRRQGRAGEGGNAPHRQKRYDAVETQHREHSHGSIPASGAFVHRSFRPASSGRRGGRPGARTVSRGASFRAAPRGARGGRVAGA